MEKILILSLFYIFIVVKTAFPQYTHNAYLYDGKISYSYSLPDGISLPDSTFNIGIRFDYNDVNKDGLEDFVFSWDKINIKDGDTIFLSVYLQSPDTTFHLLKIFKNLYPMYFSSYDPHVKTGNKKLDSLKSKYAGVYPLLNLEIKDDLILIEYGAGVGEKDSEYYKYNDSLKNWFLEKHTFKIDYGSVHEFTEYKIEKNIIPIDSFTFFKW